MRCRNEAEAKRQAQANANWSGKPWRYFTDTAGYAQCEPVPPEGSPPGQTWAGVTYHTVDPEQTNASSSNNT